MSEEQAEAIANAVKDAQETQLVTKLDLIELKMELIKWVVALMLAQTGLIIAAFKLLA
ncbi:MAG: hypothetical protein AB7D03_08435 [Thiomicrospira sp.]